MYYYAQLPNVFLLLPSLLFFLFLQVLLLLVLLLLVLFVHLILVLLLLVLLLLTQDFPLPLFLCDKVLHSLGWF